MSTLATSLRMRAPNTAAALLTEATQKATSFTSRQRRRLVINIGGHKFWERSENIL